MVPRHIPSLSLVALVCVGASLGACTTGPDVDGVWHAEAPAYAPTSELNSLVFGAPAATPLGIELVLGAYGPDAAGLVRYYRSGQFDLPRVPVRTRKECECAFLHQAKVDTSGRVTFELEACVPGTSWDAPLTLRGTLNLQANGNLEGAIAVDDPAAPQHTGKTVQLKFVRFGTTAASKPEVLDCQDPSALADGNTASGL